MALITKAIRGTQDTLPQDSYKRRYVENTVMEISQLFGYKEIRTPVFEHTELFQRSVGDTTDVVQKEMYTFNDKGGRSITLRPEGTAGVIRAFLEHGLFNEPLPQKMSYITSCYRYEKPQAGRWREFYQFGIECVGSASPSADAEVMSVANEIFNYLGIDKITLEINSIGCPKCRGEYTKALHDYFAGYKDKLCETCLSRLERNPMRILDCKSPICKEIAENAPKVLDYICDECREHFEGVKSYLDALEIDYVVNPTIVRGLDYYTKTVFEFISDENKIAICAGGRYDGLIEELGGNAMPALGFGMGIDRVLALMNEQGAAFPEDQKPELCIVSAGKQASLWAAKTATSLRNEGIGVIFDISDRSIKAQMKYANKIGARYTIVIGDNELETSTAKLKNMENSEEIDVDINTFADDFMNISIQQSIQSLDLSGLDEGDISSIFDKLE